MAKKNKKSAKTAVGVQEPAQTEVMSVIETVEAIAEPLPVVNIGIPFIPVVKSTLTSVEEEFYKRNPQLKPQ